MFHAYDHFFFFFFLIGVAGASLSLLTSHNISFNSDISIVRSSIINNMMCCNSSSIGFWSSNSCENKNTKLIPF